MRKLLGVLFDGAARVSVVQVEESLHCSQRTATGQLRLRWMQWRRLLSGLAVSQHDFGRHCGINRTHLQRLGIFFSFLKRALIMLTLFQQQATCQTFTSGLIKPVSWARVASSPSSIMAALKTYGPMSIAMDVKDSFYNYE